MLLYPTSALMTLFPVINFTTEETKVSNTKAAKGDKQKSTFLFFFYFILCFTASVTPSINTPQSANDFTILIASISLFGINKVNSFLALMTPFPLTLLSNLLIASETAFEATWLTNPGQLFLAKGIARFVTTFT